MTAAAQVSSQPVLLDKLEAGVLTLTLNRPERLNAFERQPSRSADRGDQRAAADPDCRAVLITGAGRGFCAGADLANRASAPGEARPDLGQALEKGINPLIRAIRDLPKPIVCAVNGPAAGAGANIALACDIVLAAKSAQFLQAFARIGLIPDAGGTWILPRLVGEARARALMMLAEPIGAEEAEALGDDLSRRRRSRADGRGPHARPAARARPDARARPHQTCARWLRPETASTRSSTSSAISSAKPALRMTMSKASAPFSRRGPRISWAAGGRLTPQKLAIRVDGRSQDG